MPAAWHVQRKLASGYDVCCWSSRLIPTPRMTRLRSPSLSGRPASGEAAKIGVSFIRAAIHATGAATHGWDDTDVGDQLVIYQADTDEGVEVLPLVDA